MAQRLAEIPSFVSKEGRATIAEALVKYNVLLLEKEQLLEKFKSRHAVLANSICWYS